MLCITRLINSTYITTAISSRSFHVYAPMSYIRKRSTRLPKNFHLDLEEKDDKVIDFDSLPESEKGFINMPNPFEKEKKKCILCALNIKVNYKNVKLLSQFRSSFTGRTYGRHVTGLCKVQQKLVENEIKKAQVAGLMACALKEVEFLKDPKLFDPNKPIRPHPY